MSPPVVWRQELEQSAKRYMKSKDSDHFMFWTGADPGSGKRVKFSADFVCSIECCFPCYVVNGFRGGSRIFWQGGVQLQARIQKFGLGVGRGVSTHERLRRAAAGVWGSSPMNIFKFRCSEMRFQANPTVQLWRRRKMILSCCVRHTWRFDSLPNYFAIGDKGINTCSVHIILREFFAIVHKFLEETNVGGREQGGHDTQTPWIRACA
jgi:hypothetical protein